MGSKERARRRTRMLGITGGSRSHDMTDSMKVLKDVELPQPCPKAAHLHRIALEQAVSRRASSSPHTEDVSMTALLLAALRTHRPPLPAPVGRPTPSSRVRALGGGAPGGRLCKTQTTRRGSVAVGKARTPLPSQPTRRPHPRPSPSSSPRTQPWKARTATLAKSAHGMRTAPRLARIASHSMTGGRASSDSSRRRIADCV